MAAILNFLLHNHAHNPGSEKAKEGLECALHTLRMMGRGGMHDHVGKVGVSIATILGADVSITTMLGVGVSVATMLGVGVSVAIMLGVVVSIARMLGVGVSIATMLGVGVSIATMLGVGVSISRSKRWVCLYRQHENQRNDRPHCHVGNV